MIDYQYLEALWAAQIWPEPQSEAWEASRKIAKGERPSLEERERYRSTSTQAAQLQVTTDNWEYVDIPDEVLEQRLGSAWAGPTPSAVQRVVDAISFCWNYADNLGYIPVTVEVSHLHKEDVDEFISVLDDVLREQYYTWAPRCGFRDPPSFGFLDFEDKCKVVAIIHKAVEENPELRTMFEEGS
jgi:hypothetical protein